MKINCLSCGHKIDLDDAYDDYEGDIRCFVCGANLQIKAQEGMVRAVKLALHAGRERTGEVDDVVGLVRSATLGSHAGARPARTTNKA